MPSRLSGKSILSPSTQRSSLPSLTPASNIVDAYNMFLKDPKRYGEVVECSAEKQFLVPDPPLLNGEVTKRACTVWDPLFKTMHGEDSQLPDAIA